MKRIYLIGVAAALAAACGNPGSNGGHQQAGGKASWATPEKVFWTDGGASAGAYVRAYSDRMVASYIEGLAETDYIPDGNPTPRTGYYYGVRAWTSDPLPGHLGFFVAPEARPVKLDADAFMFQVQVASTARPATEYDLALLKFYNIGGVERYTSVVMRLDEAIAGRIIGPRDEAAHAPGMIEMLQQANDGPDRLGFSGTWKVIVVPRGRAASAEVRRTGTPEVMLESAWVVASPTPAPAAAPLSPEFLATHQAVRTALAARDYEALDAYLDPSCGVFELFNPGAMVAVTNAEHVSADMNAMRYGVLDGPACTEPEVSAELPYYSCEADAYYTSGCVASPTPAYQSLGTYQDALERWVYEEPSSPEYLEKVRRCDAAISVSVTDTAGIYTLSYGEIDGRWVLIVIDTVTPCDA